MTTIDKFRKQFFFVALVGGLLLVGLGKLDGAILFAFIGGLVIPSPVSMNPRKQ